jgi:regulatory protein
MASRKPRKLNADALWEYALRILSNRACSISELRDKLRLRAEAAQDVAPILSRLKQYGYLDDTRFSAGYAAARLENQGFGRSRVLRDLRLRRVAPSVAEHAVNNAYRDVDEVTLIENFLHRKYRKVSLPQLLAEPGGLASAYRRLRLAGFSSSNVLRVLKRYAADQELLDTLEPSEETESGEAI